MFENILQWEDDGGRVFETGCSIVEQFPGNLFCQPAMIDRYFGAYQEKKKQ